MYFSLGPCPIYGSFQGLRFYTASGNHEDDYNPLFHPRLNNRPIRQQYDKEHLSHRSLHRVRKANEPEWNRTCPKFLSLQCADLYVVEGRHKIGSDLCRFLLGYGIGRILLTGFKHVLKRTAVLGRASASCCVTADLDSWKQSRSILHPAAANTRNRAAP
jgi:hypothetical protein